MSERLNPTLSTPFRNIKDSFPYLGVKITATIESMIPTNYNPVIESAVESLNRWKSINVLKMNILPSFLYLFQTIPLAPPYKLFVTMKKMFCNYIWSSRCSRLCMTLLHLPYNRGRLKLPFLQGYYWAAQRRAASYWFEHQSPLQWIRMQEITTSKIPLHLYLYSVNVAILKKHTANHFVRNTSKVSWGKCSPVPILTYLGQ